MSTEITTLDGTRHELSDETIAEIREIFHGDVVTPDDSTYDETRVVQNGMFDRRPGLIVQCTGVADVVDCVRIARERDLLLSVRGGGHSIAGTCTADDALMLDLSRMRGVWVDASERRVRVQGGAVWGDVDRETQLHGLAVPGGVISTTGVAGLTLGGGIGWLHRKYGLACDALRAAEVVLADGRVVRASADEHPDLFWALRGGGGNFGVVTTFEFDASPVGPTVWNSAVMYPLGEAEGVIERWHDWATNIPDEITTRALCWTMPEAPLLPPAVHNRDVIILAALHSGAPDDGERLCAPLSAMGEPLADLSETLPYRVAQSNFDPFFPKGEVQNYWKSVYLDDVDVDARRLIADRANHRPDPLTLVHVPMLGGAMSRVDAGATAYGDRSADYMLSFDGGWPDPADNDANIAWIRSAWDDATQLDVASGTYLNFGGDRDIDDRARERAFGRNLDRLRQVKREYDPDNRFRLNANIPPET
ncbi:MAG: FAD-binding oxidoreductase [Ilumatobacteraceae bacterium]|nr:FAD-binding oxidoreductase [Ilumatobacteraceae bacterium]